LQPLRPIGTIVVGADGSETSAQALATALRLGRLLGAEIHVVSAYGVRQAAGRAEAVLSGATRAARAEGLEATAHARRDQPAEALIAVAEEQDADLLVVGNKGMSGSSRFLLGSVPDRVSHHAPCSVLIVRTDERRPGGIMTGCGRGVERDSQEGDSDGRESDRQFPRQGEGR
jgi:nucleotide-binding universal stress UspA family protein